MIWLNPEEDQDFVWESRATEKSEEGYDVKELMNKALKGPLSSEQLEV